MRILLCVFAFSAIFPAAALARRPQQSAASATAPVKDPCPNSVTPEDKKACWTQLARRADFFLSPDPCEHESRRSDEDRDNCKIDRAKQAIDRVEAYYHSIQKALRAESARAKSSQAPAQEGDMALLVGLRNSQAVWVRYRDLQCEAETIPYDGGTVTISIKAACQREKAESRLKELQLTYSRYVTQH